LSLVVKKYQGADKSIWDAFLDKISFGHFFFKRDFMDYHSDRFTDHSLMIFEEDELVAILPANEKDKILYSHQGLTFGSLITDGLGAKKLIDCLQKVIEYGKGLGFKAIQYKCMPSIYTNGIGQNDLYALNKLDFKLWRRDINTVVNLSKEIKLRKDKRRNANKGKRLDLKIVEEADYGTYWGILENILKTYHNASPTHSLEEIERLAKSFPDNIKHFLLQDEEGNAIGGTVLFIHNGVVHTQYMSVNDQGRKIGALDYLIVHLMEKYQSTHRYFKFMTSINWICSSWRI